MSAQNYSNHVRLITGYHKIGFSLALALLVSSAWNAWVHFGTDAQMGSLILLGLVVLVLIIGFYARVFALRAQDRLIRLEENLRHQRLHGTPLPEGLDIRQVIAIRFASDEEYEGVIADALQNGTSEKAIKQSIRNWREDPYRV